MTASGTFVCEQARILFIEGLRRMTTVEEQREALRKLMLDLMQAASDNPPLEKPFRIAYSELSNEPLLDPVP